MTRWRCIERGCKITGIAEDQLTALIAFEKHYLTHMYPRKEAA